MISTTSNSSGNPNPPCQAYMTPIHNSENQVVAYCRTLLSRELNLNNGPLLESLLGHILGLKTTVPLVTVLDSLIKQGQPYSILMTLLLRCEFLHLEAVLPSLSQRPVSEQMAQLKLIFGHYEDVQRHWMALIEQRYEDRLMALSRQLDQERALHQKEQIKNLWLNTGCIELFNYFHGLLVKTKVPVEHVENQNVTVQRTPRLDRVFAADERMHRAYTLTVDMDHALWMEIQKSTSAQLTLRILEVTPHPQCQRRHVRLEIIEPVLMVVGAKGRRLGEARVQDFSETGLGLTVEPTMELRAGDEITCTGRLRAEKHQVLLQAKGNVRWHHNLGDLQHVGIELQLAPREREKVQEILRNHEQALIQKLNNRGMPDL